MTSRTHTAAVAIRTAVQALAGGGVTAAGMAALSAYGKYLPAGWAVAAAAGLTWAAAVCHNALEDHGVVGAWLRQPTLTKAGYARVAEKARKAAETETARLAKTAATAVPAAAPALDAVQAMVDRAVADALAKIPAMLPPAASTGTVYYGTIPTSGTYGTVPAPPVDPPAPPAQ